MSEQMITWVGFECRLKGYGIDVFADGPDGETKKVFIDGADLKQLYGLNPAQFYEQHGDNSAILEELFSAITGIKLA